jgi:ketosteroid isomerase-like protein
MKIRLRVALVGSAIGFLLPTFAQQKDTVDPQTAEQIRALVLKFDQTYNNGDPVAVAAFYTEDGVFETPVGTYQGWQTVEERYAKYEFGIWRDNNLIDTVDQVIAVDNGVRAIGRFSVIEHEAGNTITFQGHFSWIMVREGDTWKIRRITYDLS